ncbi:hypothetical protein CKO51_09210 [Rhodopirellula sp. SM50]|nr:TIGR03067 domain-containing protein [Rhodopirellula sp. SM50]PAY19778.1 hypothetical protein CKO51_09210 [Rhodopirellula sp. SM50]
MRHRSPLLFPALLLSLIATRTVADDDGQSPSGAESSQAVSDFQHDGVWKPKGAMMSGVLLPPPALEAITLRIEDDQYEVTVEGENHSDKGTFTLDESVTPMRMTIRSHSGPNKGKTILAIFEIKGPDAMRVCYDLSGKTFPKNFKSPRGSERYLVGYRRQPMPQTSDVPFGIGNREQPTESQLSAFAKGFCVAMRRRHAEENVPSLRGYFDPSYLQQHGLLDGDFQLQMRPVYGIRNIQLADDRRTILCYYETNQGRSEVILLRTVVREGKLYLSPVKPPDATTRRFEPWILHVAL